MPELPEVETIRRGLEGKIIGQVISSVDCDSPRHLNMSLEKFNKKISGSKITGVMRRAKMLIIELNDGVVLAIHLKMTGQLIFKHTKAVVLGGHPIKDGEINLPNKHTHVIFHFVSNDTLFFNDTRRFGWVKLLSRDQIEQELKRLSYGPEPLSDDFSFEYFLNILKKYPRKKIKQVLLDQEVVAGIGNIYADEVCYFAKIRPQRLIQTIREDEKKRIFLGIKKILEKAVKYGGSSVASHLDAFGRKGSYAQFHKVYARYGEPCFSCGSILQKTTVAGRTTTYCPQEQR